MSHSVKTASHNFAGIAALGVATVDGAQFKSYEDCQKFWGDEGWFGTSQIAPNVKLIRRVAGEYAIRFYDTDIVYYWADGTFMATLGPVNPETGRQPGSTPTTIKRLAQFTPYRYSRSKWKLAGYGAEERVPLVRPKI